MKKILFFVLIICIFATNLFAKTYTLKSNSMLLSIDENGKNPFISSIKDLKTGQEFIGNVNKESVLWSVVVKHDGNFKETPGFTLTPAKSQRIEYIQAKDSLTMKFYNVKDSKMEETFDVTCNVKIADNNTYWDMEVTPGKIYGIWEVSYPYVNNLSAKNGDNFMIPARGDVFVTEFDNPAGFPDPTKMAPDAYTKNYSVIYPKCVQYSSLTKGKSTIYMSTEDTKGTYRTMNWTTDAPNTMNVFPTYSPANMGLAGYKYKQLNLYNISVFPGDWFDAAKKYRKWGIDNNYAPFSKGKIEDRTDLPKWWKDIVWSLRIDAEDTEAGKNNVRTSMKRIGIPSLVHAYKWGKYRFDTHYPDWLPLRDGAKEYMDEIKSLGGYIMPYTNTHIVDMKLSETMKNIDPSSVVKMAWWGEPRKENWAVEAGAENTQACTSSDYYDIYMNEIKNIFKTYDFDGLYMDQVGASTSVTCFEKKHNHPLGGGTFIHDDYNRMIGEIKDAVREINGKEIVVTTEDGGDDFCFDAWLKCNESGPKSDKNPVRTVIYSGYVMNFGDQYFKEDYENDGWSVVNKIAAELTKGYVIGWDGFLRSNFHKNSFVMDYAEKAIKARFAAKEYFNLGEMVRPVKITSPIPTERQKWGSHFGTLEKDFDLVRTCSYNYKGKAMVCFTNASDKEWKISWKATPASLNLKNKGLYNISELHPEKKSVAQNAKIGGMFKIKPMDTVILIVE